MSTTRWLLLFCGIYLILSATLFINVTDENRIERDSLAYINQALRFQDSGSFAEVGAQCSSPYSIGYPIFLTLVRLVSGGGYTQVVIAQILVSLCMILLIYSLALTFFSQNIALLASLLASINLGFLIYPQFILTETLLCFLILAGFERFACYLQYKNIKALYLSGVLYGASVIVKPAAIYYVICLALLMVIINWRLYKSALLFLMMFSVPVGAYVIRNHNLYGYYYLKSIDKINLYYYFLPRILYETEGLQYNDACKRINKLSNGSELASGNRWPKIHKYFMATLKAHPLVAIKVWGHNVLKTLLGLYSNHLKVLLFDIEGGSCSFFSIPGTYWEKLLKYLEFGNSRAITMLGIVEVIWTVIRYCTASLGILLLLKRKQYIAGVLLCSYILYFALITGHDGCGRFRFIFEAPLLILTSLGFLGWRE